MNVLSRLYRRWYFNVEITTFYQRGIYVEIPTTNLNCVSKTLHLRCMYDISTSKFQLCINVLSTSYQRWYLNVLISTFHLRWNNLNVEMKTLYLPKLNQVINSYFSHVLMLITGWQLTSWIYMLFSLFLVYNIIFWLRLSVSICLYVCPYVVPWFLENYKR